MRIQLGPNLDKDLRSLTGAKDVVDRGQIALEMHVDNATANRNNGSLIVRGARAIWVPIQHERIS
jgi:hypothetical protein